MSFGFSIGDLIAVGELALRLHRECRDAPAQFAAISTEVSSLHLVLKDVDSTIRERELPPEKEADLVRISEGCRSVLTDLDALLRKYRNVGKQTRWTWDRFRWHQSDITELRSRVISNVGMLGAFYNSLNTSVTAQIEKQLIQLTLEIQSGKREASVITASSMKAAQGGDESIWWEIRRELEDAGITDEAINEHREFITTWLINAMNSGQLEEKPVRNLHQGGSEIPYDDAEHPRVEFTESPYPASHIESERALSDEVESEDGSDEFLRAAAQKIAEFHRLGREAIEASDYNEAQHHLKKANDLAVLAFGAQSRKAQDCSTLLEEASAHEKPPRAAMPSTARQKSYQGIYASSGFDMLGALVKVASRKNPEINIGKVDMSCAFVVCDITFHDCPVIYVSEIFERLTGYSKHEVLGRNCRFLQSPDGRVDAGARREFVDSDSVYYLKNTIADKKEGQLSLINYRKGGQPFMNLLTLIPITGEDDKEVKYFVGFLVDLVEKPSSIGGRNASGVYTVDYSQPMLATYVWQPPEEDIGQTIRREDVTALLSTTNSRIGGSELRSQIWDKMLLENADDLLYVLSLEGLFLYVSPSSRHVLEYDSSELLGTALSSVCHPSDMIQVTSELQDSSAGASVHVVFRIRRKKSGYVWFESLGSPYVEPEKGGKCIILAGRQRPVYSLSRHDITAAGGIGDRDIWAKLSTSGMFLFVSSNVRTLVDRSPDELIGTSMQALMRAESRGEFDQSLARARTGRRATSEHDISNKRGLVLQAQTTLYPGDASEGSKPTFLVARTRLLKSSPQTEAPALTSHSGGDRVTSSVARTDHHPVESTPLGHPSTIPSAGRGTSTPKSSPSMLARTAPASAPGLMIGSQDDALASEDNIFDELKTTRCTSWIYELQKLKSSNRLLAVELVALLSTKEKG